MGRKKFDAVHRYFTYDPKTQISKCELCGRNLKGCHSSNLKNHMVAHHPKDYAVIKALNVNIRKSIHGANNSSTSQASSKQCKIEITKENSEDEGEWLDSEFVSCQNGADNNSTSSQSDDHGDNSVTQHPQAVSTPKQNKSNNTMSPNVNGTKKDNFMESNMLFGKFIATELGRFEGKERYIVMQKIMRILME